MSKQGIGIDFGTTNSIVASFNGKDEIRAYRNVEDNLPHPSVVWYKADGAKTVGREAKRNIEGFSHQEGNRFIKSVKRFLGKNRDYVIFGENKPAFHVASDIFSFLSSNFSKQNSDQSIESAVVTVPIYFDGFARRDIRKAADRAGIYIKKFVHEPFAAVIGYYYRKDNLLRFDGLENHKILVFDWGGGTLDITITKIENGNIYELATNAMNDRAGDFFDKKICDFAKTQFVAHNYLSPAYVDIAPANMDRLIEACEWAKIRLSVEEQYPVRVYGIIDADGELLNMNEKITRRDFNELIKSTIKEAKTKIMQALEAAEITSAEIHQVLLIGGTSRIPLVIDTLNEMFGHRVRELENADSIIAEGAAIIDFFELQPILAKPVHVELSNGELYTVLPRDLEANSLTCTKEINFFCTDNRDGTANLVITGPNRHKREFLSIPVDPTITKGFHETVKVNFNLDADMILKVSGRGETQDFGNSIEIYDMNFGLRLNREDEI